MKHNYNVKIITATAWRQYMYFDGTPHYDTIRVQAESKQEAHEIVRSFYRGCRVMVDETMTDEELYDLH